MRSTQKSVSDVIIGHMVPRVTITRNSIMLALCGAVEDPDEDRDKDRDKDHDKDNDNDNTNAMTTRTASAAVVIHGVYHLL